MTRLSRRGRRLHRAGALVAAALVLGIAATSAVAGSGGAATPGGTHPGGNDARGPNPFARAGMWIWVMDYSHGGNPREIARQARSSRIGTVYIKSGDGSDAWSQFNRVLLRRLHRAGLKVCAWQFVYGEHPAAEARVGAVSVEKGADCLIIDAEGHYEGRYAEADRYIRRLRARIGPGFPLALASFPYVDYHPGFPYSVFLGPGGAQYNLPQMYWKAIGTTVRGVFEHTYFWNRVFKRPIYPIGQTYDRPGLKQIQAFRHFAVEYRAGGISWWSWQETDAHEWRALARPVTSGVRNYGPIRGHPTLNIGDRGDLVVWAQMHLLGAGQRCDGRLETATGVFGKITRCAIRRLQAGQGLQVTGAIDSGTWRVLLKRRPQRIAWSNPRRGRARPAAGASTGRAPISASLPARAYEIDPGPRP